MEFNFNKKPSRVEEEVMERNAQESESKKIASEATKSRYEGPVTLKEIKDPKVLAMIEFLNKYPNWAKKFDEAREKEEKGTPLSVNTKISAETMNLVAAEMESPNLNYFFDEKKNEGFYETIQMKEFREAKGEFMAKFGAKIETWKSKGLTADENELVKAYMKDKSLDLVTTPDNKVAWGTPVAGYEFTK